MYLNIQPIAYNGNRLEEIAERVAAVYFHTRKGQYAASRSEILEKCKIHENIPLANLPKGLFFGKARNAKECLDSTKLPQYLFDLCGAPTLGITSLLCSSNVFDDSDGGKILGLGLYSGHRIGDNPAVGFISTNDSQFGEIDSDWYVNLVTRSAVHEIGHFFRLEHHYELAFNMYKEPCPMIAGIEPYIVLLRTMGKKDFMELQPPKSLSFASSLSFSSSAVPLTAFVFSAFI